MRFLSIAALITSIATSVGAQEPIFDNYISMRGEMDRLMMNRNIPELMIKFGGADEMTKEQLDRLDAQVGQLYPNDFEHVAVIRRGALEGGFQQELLSYWTGIAYVYAYVLYHDRGNEMVAINFRFNSDFTTLNSLF
ncbi:hypothetical protein [Pelagimonas varians]|uniref:DUF3887 domain-containing protein n=1 Tax=Pelagimonas varians TaxID=696760 RepID=A0A238K921_9RHOB|nr:hypothetical protein [Pelagimonas varians]PYG31891.1 hypothetical protein C8N36_104316 [Pelagimonas varians]SMX38466.1 hypothetical protein PEV8663_01328 [Pelagimonas varians]